MKSLLSTLLMLILALEVAGRGAGESEFEAGNRAYDEKNYQAARDRYAALVSQGVWTANVFYNLGRANEQLGDTGRAILNYERALTLDPRHRDAFAALDLARKNSTAKIATRTWREIGLGLLTFDQWLILATTAGWLAVFVFLVRMVRRRRFGFAGGSTLAISLLVAAVAGTAAWFKSADLNAAVILVKQADARFAPADRASLADTLPAGSRVQWLSERSGWVECRLPSGSRAWVPASTLERVRLSASS